MPKGFFFWTDQVKTCNDIDQAWEILENEFANERKLMDELLAEMNNLKQVKRDSKSLTRFATTISVFVHDMKDNGCIVLEAGQKIHSSCLSFCRSWTQETTQTLEERCKERKGRKCVKSRNLVTSRGNPSLQKQTRQ